MTVSFYQPSFIVKNLSTKAVRVLDSATIQPGETVDLYSLYEPQTELFEDKIIKALEKPWGDLYVEVVQKRSLELISCDLSSWHYAIVAPSNINANNTFFPGAVPSAVDEDTFIWVDASSGLTATPPLNISGGIISIPAAASGVSGYLTSTDWARFNSSVKPDMQIWQYQDFTAPVASSVTLTAFENGTLSFNSGYLLDGTAAVTLTSDPASPPTTTNSIPAKYLPGNRVTVSSHISTTVTFDNTPAVTQNVRVYHLIRLPTGVALPTDYQEDPEFLNDSSLDFIDDNYVNQNQDESVYGIKTWESQQIFNGAIQIPTGAVDGYVLTSDGSGNATWEISVGGGGATELDDLTDVDLVTTPPFVGSLLGFDGYVWTPLEGDTMYNKEIDEIAGGDLYIGEALPGTLTSEAKWRIQFVDFTKTGSLEDISITWADGDALFDNVWDDRLTLSYS
jgi:hypothetical protein